MISYLRASYITETHEFYVGVYKGEPFVEEISSKISGKKVALFGSYGWGDGQWMRDWQERMESLGCTLIADGLIIQNESEDNSPECIELGMTIAKA